MATFEYWDTLGKHVVPAVGKKPRVRCECGKLSSRQWATWREIELGFSHPATCPVNEGHVVARERAFDAYELSIYGD